jgi:hypothetical protein
MAPNSTRFGSSSASCSTPSSTNRPSSGCRGAERWLRDHTPGRDNPPGLEAHPKPSSAPVVTRPDGPLSDARHRVGRRRAVHPVTVSTLGQGANLVGPA